MTNNEKRQQAFLESILNGSTIEAACEASGIGRSTYYRWKASGNQGHVNFCLEVEAAKQSRIGIVEDALFKKASKGHPTAMIFFLCNRDPHKWKNAHHVKADFNHDMDFILLASSMSKEQIQDTVDMLIRERHKRMTKEEIGVEIQEIEKEHDRLESLFAKRGKKRQVSRNEGQPPNQH